MSDQSENPAPNAPGDLGRVEAFREMLAREFRRGADPFLDAFEVGGDPPPPPTPERLADLEALEALINRNVRRADP